MNGAKPRTGAPAKFSTASVHVIFQTRPGIGAGKIIRDAGPATLNFRSGEIRKVECRDGIYHFDIHGKVDCVLEILDSQFPVRVLEANESDAAGSGAITQWKSPLLPANTLKGAQQRLQLLGYYGGGVDGNMGRKIERAILEFQADDGTLAIDGVADAKTQNALDAFFQKNAVDASGTGFLIRRYLTRFERARTGDTSALCPHPDYRGGDDTVVSYGYQIKSMADRDRKSGASGQSFFVGLDFDGLSFTDDTVLVPRFKKDPDFGLVRLIKNDDAFQKSNRYNRPYLEVTPRVNDGADTLNLHYGSEKGPVVASLEVRSPEMRHVKVSLHLLTIEDAAGKSVPPWTEQEAMGLMEMINAVWMPMGVGFSVQETNSHAFKGANAGTITSDYTGWRWKLKEHQEIWRRFNFKKKDRINIYFCEKILQLNLNGSKVESNTRILGFAISRARIKSERPIGVCVRREADRFTLALTIAHELGHMLNLTCHSYAHSDDDGTDTPFRHDIWSRCRLMAKYSGYFLHDPPRNWQDSSYGLHGNELKSGAWLTIKKLPSDGTDNELEITRIAASNPY